MRFFYFSTASAYFFCLKASATCYFPNGTVDATGKQAPCNKSGPSMCCLLENVGSEDADTCTSDGLCIPSVNDAPYRDTCTDKNWGSGCLSLCVNGMDDYGTPRDSILQILTVCADGSFCCGDPRRSTGRDCCAKKEGLFVVDAKLVESKPTSSSASGNPQPTSATSEPSRSATSTSNPSSSNTGAIVGGVVGGIAAVTILAFAFWWFIIRRKLRQQPQLFSHSFEPHRNFAGTQKSWQDRSEVLGDLRRGELDGTATTSAVESSELEGWQAIK